MAEAKVDNPITLRTRVTKLPGIGKARAGRLGKLGIKTVADLIRHLPMRYEFVHAQAPIRELPKEGLARAIGMVAAARWQQGGRGGGGSGGRGKGRYEVTLQDDTGSLNLVWFNAGYLRDKIHPGMQLAVQGQIKSFGGYPQIVNPQWTVLQDEEGEEPEQNNEQSTDDDAYRPVYPATENLPSRVIADLIDGVLDHVLDQLVDPLPAEFVKAHNMPTLADAFRMAHRPEHEDEAAAARRRLAYNELILLQLGIALKRKYNQTRLAAPAMQYSNATDQHIRERLPFELTDDQNHVVGDIVTDMQKPTPMNRLLQGDVGSGKTLVALYSMLLSVMNNKQGALMAPTELLAEQHYQSISRILKGAHVTIELLSASKGASRSAARKETLERIESGEVDIIIGTQALLSESLQFHDLGVVVIDEQHRFGVLQRAAFRAKSPAAKTEAESAADTIASPHYLVMTATPIPRTLSLTVFGDLDVSTIRHLPPGRSPITTRVVPSETSDDVYEYISTRLAKGEQAYVVVPVIEDSDDPTAKKLKNVTEHTEKLQAKYFADFEVAYVHGRMKPEERDDVMQRFRDGDVHVLVATTVIEIGVDVPNATIMVVEHAERFGLAQLHQLRGRIGRGTKKVKNLCVFIADCTTEQAQQRMEAIGSTTDGFRIAEHDLEIRGMGDFFGTRQHGMPPLRVARIPADMDLLQLAKRDAVAIVDESPALDDEKWLRLRKVLQQQYGEALGLIDVG